MESNINPIDLIANLKEKETSLLSLSNSNKDNYLKYRVDVMQELKDLCYNELIINYEEVFYLSVTYLDIIFIQNNNITIGNKTIRDNFTISCLTLAIKMIGKLKRNIFKMPPFSDSTRKEYEGYCLQMLNCNLIYSTPYDYIKLMFGSNVKLFETARNILALAVFNNFYLNHSYFPIAMGIINNSIDLIKQPLRYAIAYKKWIHSSEAEKFKKVLQK